MSEKIPLIFFSGGLDSTAMLWMALMDSDVDIVYADGSQGRMKMHAEKLAQAKILDYMETHAEHKVRKQYTIDAIGPRNDNNRLMGAVKLRGPQQPAWFIAAWYLVDPTRHSKVCMGVVRGDSSAHICHLYSQAWLPFLVASKNGVPADMPPLEFPLLEYTKQSFIHGLPEDLQALIWTCETPKYESPNVVACGNCTPCRTLAAAKDEYADPPNRYAQDTTLEFLIDHGSDEEQTTARTELARLRRCQTLASILGRESDVMPTVQPKLRIKLKHPVTQ